MTLVARLCLCLVVLAGPGCLDVSQSSCETGLVCPEGYRCNDALDRCVLESCGNGLIDPGEDCDGTNLGLLTCPNAVGDVDGDGVIEDFHSGDLACNADCSLDLSACSYCGDGVLDDGFELCDGESVPLIASCGSFGYDRGPLACSGDCRRLTDRCEVVGRKEMLLLPVAARAIAGFSPNDLLIRTESAVLHYDGLQSRVEALAIAAPANDGLEVTPRGYGALLTTPPDSSGVLLMIRGLNGLWTSFDTDLEDPTAPLAIVDDGEGYLVLILVSSVVGEQRLALFNGQAWSTLDVVSPAEATSVWARSADDVYVSGPTICYPLFFACDTRPTAIVHWNGAEWRTIYSADSEFGLGSLTGSDSTVLVSSGISLERVLADGLELIHEVLIPVRPWTAHEGHALWTGWTTSNELEMFVTGDQRIESLGIVPSIPDLWGSAPWHILAAYEHSLERFDGSAYLTGTAERDEQISDVWAADYDEALAVGELGRTIRFDGDSWQDVCGVTETPACPPTVALEAVTGPSMDNAFAVDSSFAVYRWDGDQWTLDHDTIADAKGRDIATAGNAVFAVGAFDNTSRMLRRDELGQWTEWNLPGKALQSVSAIDDANAIAVGGNTAYRYQAGQWNLIEALEATPAFYDTWALGLDDIYVLGRTSNESLGQRVLWHFDGGQWTDTVLEGTGYLTLGGSGPDDLFMWGPVSALHSTNGVEWTRFAPQERADEIFVVPGAVFMAAPARSRYGLLRRFVPWSGCGNSETDCSDGVDNDCDGYLDRTDADCAEDL